MGRKSKIRGYMYMWGFPGGASVKEPICQYRRPKRRGFDPWLGKIPWWRTWQPTPVLLPGESHGQRSLAGYSPWGCAESDKTEATHTHTPCCLWTWYLLFLVLSNVTLHGLRSFLMYGFIAINFTLRTAFIALSFCMLYFHFCLPEDTF